MEESSEVQYEEIKEHPDKNKRRRFKTPSQLQGLEEFYNEHKYPTESMKAELAEKLGLTEKQVSGWFCHRRLKDKRLLKDETSAPGRQDVSSGVVQDRGSGLKQDSCSSTKQGDYRLADLSGVDSQRSWHDDLAPSGPNYDARELYDGAGIDDTSSESNSDLQESFYPNNGNPLDMETMKYKAPNGFIAKDGKRVGPSGYLKIKGQTENAAITAVKRQLGRLYLEDGPSLGVEFDPLPPGAFEVLTKSTNNDSYRYHEPIASGSGIQKRHGLGNKRNQDIYIEATEYRHLHTLDQEDFPHHQPRKKQPLSNHSNGFLRQKSSFVVDPYSARESSKYDASLNCNIQCKRDVAKMRPNPYPEHQSQPFGRKVISEAAEVPWSLSYDNVDTKFSHKRDQLDSRAAALALRLKNPINIEDRVPPSKIAKDEEIYMERRSISDLHDSIRVKKLGKKGREEFAQEDYSTRSSSQELPQWSRQMKRATTEMPSSFSEDETAETSSSVD